MQPAPGSQRNGVETSNLDGHSALIVDDSATNRRIIETQLTHWGMKTTSVSSAEDATRQMASQTFDVALLDLQMPDMDGIDLAQKIRRQSQMPLILLSSSGERFTGDEARLFQYQIAKPVKHSLLYDALIRILDTERGTALRAAEKAGGQREAAPEKRHDSGL